MHCAFALLTDSLNAADLPVPKPACHHKQHTSRRLHLSCINIFVMFCQATSMPSNIWANIWMYPHGPNLVHQQTRCSAHAFDFKLLLCRAIQIISHTCTAAQPTMGKLMFTRPPPHSEGPRTNFHMQHQSSHSSLIEELLLLDVYIAYVITYLHSSCVGPA